MSQGDPSLPAVLFKSTEQTPGWKFPPPDEIFLIGIPICTHPNFKSLLGKPPFGEITIISYAGRIRHGTQMKTMWNGQCSCGKKRIFFGDNLVRGHTTNCGCVIDAKVKIGLRFRHGHAIHDKISSEYWTWQGIKKRCCDPDEPGYKNYGARGISVYPAWLESFDNFYADMGPKPSPKHSIDRIDNNGNYDPENCRWATQKQQARNMRANRMITYRNETRCLAEWSEMTGISADCISQRIDKLGWPVEKALGSKPYHKSISPQPPSSDPIESAPQVPAEPSLCQPHTPESPAAGRT